jgi:hypothetical protein
MMEESIEGMQEEQKCKKNEFLFIGMDNIILLTVLHPLICLQPTDYHPLLKVCPSTMRDNLWILASWIFLLSDDVL